MSFLATAICALALGQTNPTTGLSAGSIKPAPKPDAVVATVNGVPIKAKDVDDLLWSWRGQEVIDEIVGYQMALQEAKKRKVSVSKAEVDKELNLTLEQTKKTLPQGQTLEAWMHAQGFTRQRLFMRVATGLLIDKMVLQSFDAKAWVKVSTMIFRPFDASTGALSDAIGRADKAYGRLRSGEAWEAVLKSVTNEEAAIRSNGLLGWRTLDLFPETVRVTLSTATPGTVAQPIQTQSGIQIFRFELRGTNAKGEELEELKASHIQAGRGLMLQELRNKTKIERRLP